MSLSGATFCVTGTLSRLRRDVEALLREHGAAISTNVTGQTTHLMCNDPSPTSNKYRKALSVGVTIVSEETVMAMIGFSSDAVLDGGGGDGRSAVVSSSSASSLAADPASITNTTPAIAAAFPVVIRDIADGEQATAGANHQYIMKNIGGVYSCNCPSWRFQSKPIDVRTCKHLKELRGEAAELLRIGSAHSTTTPASPNQKKRAAASNSPSGSSTTATPVKKQKGSSSAADSGDTPPTAAAAAPGLFPAANLMLAHSYNVEKADQYQYSDYLLSEKLDGMRALWDGVQLVSRNGHRIHAPDYFIAGLPATVALDGELFGGRGQFQSTISIARRQNGGELWRQLKFVVFDAPSEPGGFEDRLAKVFEQVASLEFVVVHPHEPCRDRQHLEQELVRIEALDGEGLMLRKKGSAYRPGRTDVLLKVKTFHDDEAIVYGHQPGQGKHTGRLGALLCRFLNPTLVEFKVGTGLSDHDRQNPPPIGSVITFRYFEMTQAGVPRFPSYVRVRPDIDPSRFATT
jgi:DNA ligase 1